MVTFKPKFLTLQTHSGNHSSLQWPLATQSSSEAQSTTELFLCRAVHVPPTHLSFFSPQHSMAAQLLSFSTKDPKDFLFHLPLVTAPFRTCLKTWPPLVSNLRLRDLLPFSFLVEQRHWSHKSQRQKAFIDWIPINIRPLPRIRLGLMPSLLCSSYSNV